MPRDYTPRLLQPLLVPDHPWQHILIDFKSFPYNKNGYNAILVVVDRLSKQAFSLPCFKTTTAKDMAELYIQYIYYIKGVLDTIILNYGL
jgi:hypothetical protein